MIIYWEYIIKYKDPLDNIEEERSGVVTGNTISEAMKEIETYYDADCITDIISFRYITDCLIDFKDLDDEQKSFLKEQIKKY